MEDKKSHTAALPVAKHQGLFHSKHGATPK